MSSHRRRLHSFHEDYDENDYSNEDNYDGDPPVPKLVERMKLSLDDDESSFPNNGESEYDEADDDDDEVEEERQRQMFMRERSRSRSIHGKHENINAGIILIDPSAISSDTGASKHVDIQQKSGPLQLREVEALKKVWS
jgi:hypothetical protein